MTASDVAIAITHAAEQVFKGLLAALEEDNLPADLVARLRRTLLEQNDFTERSITAAPFAAETKL
jgi:hypothetical protein